MNREIKFRVWFAAEKRMINIGSVTNDTALWIEERGWDAVDHLTGKPITICSNIANKNPENILMQLTEFKDHFGVSIYEGDIVLVENEDDVITECKWDKGGFGLEDLAGGNWARQLYHQPERLTVVGNIYENADLINEK